MSSGRIHVAWSEMKTNRGVGTAAATGLFHYRELNYSVVHFCALAHHARHPLAGVLIRFPLKGEAQIKCVLESTN